MSARALVQNRWVRLARETLAGWMAADAPSKGAAIAYYAMFSMAPLIFLIISMPSPRRFLAARSCAA